MLFSIELASFFSSRYVIKEAQQRTFPHEQVWYVVTLSFNVLWQCELFYKKWNMKKNCKSSELQCLDVRKFQHFIVQQLLMCCRWLVIGDERSLRQQKWRTEEERVIIPTILGFEWGKRSLKFIWIFATASASKLFREIVIFLTRRSENVSIEEGKTGFFIRRCINSPPRSHSHNYLLLQKRL